MYLITPSLHSSYYWYQKLETATKESFLDTLTKKETPKTDAIKKGKPVIYVWSEELRSVFKEAIEVRPVDISPFLFCNRAGESYMDKETNLCSGWDSMWQRFMSRLLKETKITERFTEHDLRAKCASDATSLQHAQKLLAHADSKITQRVYRRRPEKVHPLR